MSGGADHADDPSIRNCSELWRRVHPTHFIFDQNLGRMRPTSQAFTDSKDGTPMSVLQARVVAATNRDEYSVLRNHPGYALVAFTARLARQLGQGVEPNPLPDEPAHTYVFGDKKKKAVKEAFAKNAVWVAKPDANNRVEVPENSRPNRGRFLLKRILRDATRLRQLVSSYYFVSRGKIGMCASKTMRECMQLVKKLKLRK